MLNSLNSLAWLISKVKRGTQFIWGEVKIWEDDSVIERLAGQMQYVCLNKNAPTPYDRFTCLRYSHQTAALFGKCVGVMLLYVVKVFLLLFKC